MGNKNKKASKARQFYQNYLRTLNASQKAAGLPKIQPVNVGQIARDLIINELGLGSRTWASRTFSELAIRLAYYEDIIDLLHSFAQAYANTSNKKRMDARMAALASKTARTAQHLKLETDVGEAWFALADKGVPERFRTKQIWLDMTEVNQAKLGRSPSRRTIEGITKKLKAQ